MRTAILLLAGVGLAGCATKSVYLLTDGRLPASDPVLNQQFEADRAICQGGSDVCMAGKGYVLVPEDQVPIKQQELAAIAAEKARRETVVSKPSLTAAKKKPAKQELSIRPPP